MDDDRAVAWWVLVGAAAGALSGLLVGGVGGRLAMFLLRLTSPDAVLGLTSDDGFEIGVVTTDTLGLLVGMSFLGAVNGIAYATVRTAIPPRVRLPLWSLLATAIVGATVVHSDGVDFTLLEPAVLAVLLFLLLPAGAAALVVVLVERWVVLDPSTNRRLVVALALGACAGTLALVLGALVGAVAIVIRRTGLARGLAAVARVVVPVGIVALTAFAAVDLARDVSAIF